MYTGKITFIQGELQGSSIDLQPGKQQGMFRRMQFLCSYFPPGKDHTDQEP